MRSWSGGNEKASGKINEAFFNYRQVFLLDAPAAVFASVMSNVPDSSEPPRHGGTFCDLAHGIAKLLALFLGRGCTASLATSSLVSVVMTVLHYPSLG